MIQGTLFHKTELTAAKPRADSNMSSTCQYCFDGPFKHVRKHYRFCKEIDKQ